MTASTPARESMYETNLERTGVNVGQAQGRKENTQPVRPMRNRIHPSTNIRLSNVYLNFILE